jgi:hypothetical protein
MKLLTLCALGASLLAGCVLDVDQSRLPHLHWPPVAAQTPRPRYDCDGSFDPHTGLDVKRKQRRRIVPLRFEKPPLRPFVIRVDDPIADHQRLADVSPHIEFDNPYYTWLSDATRGQQVRSVLEAHPEERANMTDDLRHCLACLAILEFIRGGGEPLEV